MKLSDAQREADAKIGELAPVHESFVRARLQRARAERLISLRKTVGDIAGILTRVCPNPAKCLDVKLETFALPHPEDAKELAQPSLLVVTRLWPRQGKDSSDFVELSYYRAVNFDPAFEHEDVASVNTGPGKTVQGIYIGSEDSPSVNDKGAPWQPDMDPDQLNATALTWEPRLIEMNRMLTMLAGQAIQSDVR